MALFAAYAVLPLLAWFLAVIPATDIFIAALLLKFSLKSTLVPSFAFDLTLSIITFNSFLTLLTGLLYNPNSLLKRTHLSTFRSFLHLFQLLYLPLDPFNILFDLQSLLIGIIRLLWPYLGSGCKIVLVRLCGMIVVRVWRSISIIAWAFLVEWTRLMAGFVLLRLVWPQVNVIFGRWVKGFLTLKPNGIPWNRLWLSSVLFLRTLLHTAIVLFLSCLILLVIFVKLYIFDFSTILNHLTNYQLIQPIQEILSIRIVQSSLEIGIKVGI